MFEKKSKYKFLDFSIFCVKIVYLIIVIIALLILCVVKPSTLYFDMILILLISTFIIYLCIKEIKNRNYRINELANGFDSVLKNSLNVIDIPMIIIGDHNKIIWQNNIAKHIIPLEVIHDSALQIDRQINQNQGNGLLSVDIGNGSVYDVIGNNILIKENKVTLLSFINRTVESELRKSLEDTRAVVGILFIDNYEETLQGLDSVNRAEISSMIEKEIRTWVVENNGILNKLDKDKYVLFIEKQYVEQMEKNTFEILERVKNITDKTKLPITISIGMSYSENTLNERYMASSSALDIALGRGGDQVVIKKDKKFDFYGGSNLGLEKTSRVRARTIAQALKELMLKWSADRTDLVKLKEVLNRWQNGLRETSWNCLFWGNHDQPRAVSKFGCDLPEYRVLSAKMLCACLYLMQGTPYIYQGEEIGMPNPHFTSLEQYRDIESICAYHDFVDSGVVEKRMMLTLLAHTSRDNARTPMQWNSRFCAGFSSAPPWISLGYSWRAVNVEQEEKDENSVLHFYRDILAFRKGNPLIRYGTFELLCADDPHIFAYVRTYQGKRLLVICNFSEKSQNAAAIYPNPEAIRFHNYPSITPAVLRPFELIAAL